MLIILFYKVHFHLFIFLISIFLIDFFFFEAFHSSSNNNEENGRSNSHFSFEIIIHELFWLKYIA